MQNAAKLWSMVIFSMSLVACATPIKKEKSPEARVWGTWRLKSIVRITPQGKEIPWCTLPKGLITYTPWGYMSASINCDETTPANAPSRAFANMLLYAGTYDVSEDGKVSHHIQDSSFREIDGKSLIREIVKLEGDTLILDGKSANNTGAVRVEWTRAAGPNLNPTP